MGRIAKEGKDRVGKKGDNPNSMYFDDAGHPRIKNGEGVVIPYPRLVTVEGAWRDKCLLEVETVEKARVGARICSNFFELGEWTALTPDQN